MLFFRLTWFLNSATTYIRPPIPIGPWYYTYCLPRKCCKDLTRRMKKRIENLQLCIRTWEGFLFYHWKHFAISLNIVVAEEMNESFSFNDISKLMNGCMFFRSIGTSRNAFQRESWNDVAVSKNKNYTHVHPNLILKQI